MKVDVLYMKVDVLYMKVDVLFSIYHAELFLE